jgi:hypothetical protein
MLQTFMRARNGGTHMSSKITSGQFLWMPLVMLSWENVMVLAEGVAHPVEGVKNICGLVPVYESCEEAEAAYPDAEIVPLTIDQTNAQ